MATASPEIGVRLGTVSLTDSKDRDIVHLAPCSDSSNLRVSRIKFTVNAYPAQVDSLKVVYRNGGVDTLTVKNHFAVDSGSRWIDLKGNQRCISRIIVHGDTDTAAIRPGRQAKVTFYGIQ